LEGGRNRFREALRTEFVVTWELVPGRGAFGKAQEDIFQAVERLAGDGRVHALTITDNPGGDPAMAADYLGMELARQGIEVIIHFTCKDKNRSQIESQLYALHRAGVHNLLVMSGDYPANGCLGRPKPVFDFDPIHVLRMIGEMNAGFEVPAFGPPEVLAPTNFYAGAAVSPFKKEEGEQLGQYYKLRKKVAAGAQFIITQLGYDARKFHEVLQFVRNAGWNIPLIGNIYVLTYGIARLMYQNQLPGCVVTEKLMEELVLERQGADKGKGARLLRAAKLYALMKGMGYAGVHIGGHGLNYEDVICILEKGEELVPNWPELVGEFDYPQEDGFYYFQRDEATGLNTPEPTNRNGALPAKGLDNRFFRLLHHTLFDERGIFYHPMRLFSKVVDGTRLEGPVTWLEHLIKLISNNCQQCGDCALFDLAYLCPMSQCPKNQRNGPCGGSFEGWCEVYPNKRRCLYIRAYERLKAYGEEDNLGRYEIPPCNWSLRHTSSWFNFYLGRDHGSGVLDLTDEGRR
jgi:methylenetetrahydrofolate reductase (NADPH)